MKPIYLIFAILIMFQSGLLWSAIDNKADSSFIISVIVVIIVTVLGMLVFTDAGRELIKTTRKTKSESGSS